MTSRMSSGGAWLIAINFMSISTASAETPVGVLGAHGKVRIAAAESSVVLRDQAYFSNDNVQTREGARAAVQLNNDCGAPSLAPLKTTVTSAGLVPAFIATISVVHGLLDDDKPSSRPYRPVQGCAGNEGGGGLRQ